MNARTRILPVDGGWRWELHIEDAVVIATGPVAKTRDEAVALYGAARAIMQLVGGTSFTKVGDQILGAFQKPESD